MLGKTHLAMGVACSLLALQPKTPKDFIVAIIGGAAGGVMADIDVKIDRSNPIAKQKSMDALYGEITAIAVSAVLLWLDYVKGYGICKGILERPILPIIGIVGMIILIVIGELSEHRDRTHSLLAMLLFSLTAFLINPGIGISFLIGYASHLLLDLLNKKPIRLLYPLQNGFCLNLCYANRMVNELLFSIGICITILMLVWNL